MAATAGYSSTPLARKLGVKADHRLVYWSAPQGWDVPDLPDSVEVRHEDGGSGTGTGTGSGSDGGSSGDGGGGGEGGDMRRVDVCVAFCRTPDALRAAVATFAERIRPAGALWIAWPRKAAGHRSEVTENLVRDVVLPLGLVDTKVAALDHDWSGLKVVWRRDRR